MVRCSMPSCTWVAHPPCRLIRFSSTLPSASTPNEYTAHRIGRANPRCAPLILSSPGTVSSPTTRRALERLPPRRPRAKGCPRSTRRTPPARRLCPPPTDGSAAWAARNAQDPARGGAPGAARRAPTPTVGPMPPRRRGTGGSAPRLHRTHPIKAGGSTPNRTRCPALDPTRPRTGGIGTPPSGGETKATRGTNLRQGTRSPKRIRTRPCARVGKRIAPPPRWSFFLRHRGHPAAADCQRPWRRQLRSICGYRTMAGIDSFST
jgi:hypothetical protein